jgi:hypothetical protein
MDATVLLRIDDFCRNLTLSLLHLSDKTPLSTSGASVDRTVPAITLMWLLAERLLMNVNFTTISMAIVVGWIGLCFASTFLPSFQFGDLSLRTSWKELTAKRESRLDVLDVFRVIAIVWVTINHLGSEGRIDVLERLPSAKGFKDAIHSDPIFGALLGNSALGVEIFLVLSGLLAARSWNRKADSSFGPHCRSFLIKRWFRLFPVVAAFIFLAAGPLMKIILPRYHTSMVSTCGTRGILSHLFLVSNWQSTPTCLGYLWYLGLDMQLYVMAPFLLHFLHTKPRIAVSIIAFLVSASAAMRAVYCQYYGMCNRSDVDIPVS